MTAQRKTYVRSTAAASGGHMRAGRLWPTGATTVTVDLECDLPRPDRIEARIINAEDLKALQRDPRIMVDGYPHIPRAVWEPEDLAVAAVREQAAIEENRRVLAEKEALANRVQQRGAGQFE